MQRQVSLITFVILNFLSTALVGQKDTLVLDLEQMLGLAVENALELKIIQSSFKENQLNISWLQERLKPRLFANATLPNLSRAIELRPLPDGRDAFVNRSTMNNSFGLSLVYNLISTGGTLTASSNLDRLDIFKTDLFDYSKTYFFTPISVSYTQPFFQFNELRWQRDRLKLLNKELNARQAFIREEIINTAILLYTEIFQAQIIIALNEQKKKEIEDLYQIKKRLADLGKVDKIEILRLELERENTINLLEQALLNWNNARLKICDFLRLERKRSIQVTAPNFISKVKIDPDIAISYALENAYVTALYNLRVKEAEAESERTNKDNGVNVSLDLSLGLNKTDEELSQLYRQFLDRQTLSVSIQFPLNSNKARFIRREIATEQLFQERISIEKEKIEITQNLLENISRFNFLVNSLSFLQRNQNTTEEIFQLSLQQYRLGQKSITELNIARTEREQSQTSYFKALLETISTYYAIRKLCLYDFINQQKLSK